MSGVHKYPTISFRISPRERDEIEAKIKASGMQKKDYFVRSCIYNKVCVVGKKEVIYQLVEELHLMQYNITEILKQFEEQEILLSDEGLEQMKNDCLDMLKAIIWMLDGAKYLWQGTEKSISAREHRRIKKKVLTAATVRTYEKSDNLCYQDIYKISVTEVLRRNNRIFEWRTLWKNRKLN